MLHQEGGCCGHHSEGHERGGCCGHHSEGHEHGGCCGHHSEGHEHDGCCGHSHEETPAYTDDEKVALLAYMLGHNGHHLEELHALSHQLEGEAADLLHLAVEDLVSCNTKMAEALQLLQK